MKLRFLQSKYLRWSNTVRSAFLVLILFFIGNKIIIGQPYYIPTASSLIGYDPGDNICSFCEFFDHGAYNIATGWGGGSFDPEGNFYILSWGDEPPFTFQNNIYQIDLPSLNATLIMDGPDVDEEMRGLAAVGGDIFYTLSRSNDNDTLYRWDANDGTIQAVGALGYQPWSELWIAEGEMYYIAFKIGVDSERRIIRVDPVNPANSEEICSFDDSYGIFGLTATPVSGLFIGTEIWINELMVVTLNINDCSITEICDISQNGYGGAIVNNTSIYEHDLDLETLVYIDLDCDDSSGATEADYNGDPFDCLNEEGVGINDIDVRIYSDAPITEMRIELTNPIDIPEEKLIMSGATPGINVTGSGSTFITLTNTGGAKASDFNNALDLIRYINSALYPTAGQRIIEVQFTTAAGTESNTASAFIEVIELPHVPVDLGPDVEICEGEIATLDASGTGDVYEWSNGATTSTINVSNSGIYSVTVSDGVNCPNTDEVVVSVLPIVTLSLVGDTAICENGSATLTIITDTPYPLTIDIDASPGSPFTFTDVTGNFDFTDVPFTITEYTITNVTASEPACFNIVDNYQVIEIFPHYNDSADVLLCGGDSILLGNVWVSEAGSYPVLFNSIHGCDSSVYFTVSTLPGDSIFYQSWTCDPTEAGVFLSYLDNPNGCDTVVQSTVTLLPSDTTVFNLFSCNSDSTGTFIEVFVFQSQCDSLVITNINLIPPEDTTAFYISTCDSSATGVFQQTLTNNEGCDSLIITTVSLAPADTTYLYGFSCDSASIGIFQTLYSNQSGCDSLVIQNVSSGVPDTTYLFATSCDSASLGIFETHFVTMTGCDSVVFNTVSYSANDSTFINAVSCDPAEVGVFVENLVNRFGCDSIVTTTVEQAISHSILLAGSSCNPADTGVFIQNLVNQHGCDSVVTTTIDLLPTHATFLNSTTCNSAEAGMFITVHLNQFGCDSIVTHAVAFIASDTTRLFSKTCFENETGIVESYFANQHGCDSVVIEMTELYPLPDLAIQATSDFNGYAISCFAANDGSAEAIPSGNPPWSYIWSNGSTDATITGLSAGLYEVTVTDANGCTISSEITLEEPALMSINLTISEPDCFEEQEGVITINPFGGVGPFLYSIDGINFQSSNIFAELAEGTYHVTILDANECEEREIIWINVPLNVNVDLGMDRMISLGDTSLIEAIVNVPFDSLSAIIWSGIDNQECPECLTQPVAPIITTTYSLTVTSIDGCMDKDALTLFVEIDDDIYVPNIFSPNGDQVNDKLLIETGSSIKEILTFTIYDRWGNMVFNAQHFQPGDLLNSWDGRMKGKEMDPGVFAYMLIAELKGGGQVIRYGDVTIVR